VLQLSSAAEKELETEATIGKVRIELSVDARYQSRFEIDYGIWRTDITQNMWY
jgi:hypothetical protein